MPSCALTRDIANYIELVGTYTYAIALYIFYWCIKKYECYI